MADRQGRDCSVLESALGNESMVTLLELWYMQAMYSGDVDSVEDFSKAGRDPTKVMLDGTMPLLLEVELSLEMYACLWRHCVRRERKEGVMEGVEQGVEGVEVGEVEEHRKRVLLPWLAKREEREMERKKKEEEAPKKIVKVQLRDIQCTMIFSNDVVCLEEVVGSSGSGGSGGSGGGSGSGSGSGASAAGVGNEVKSHQPESAARDEVRAEIKSDFVGSGGDGSLTRSFSASDSFVERTSHVDISSINVLDSCVSRNVLVHDAMRKFTKRTMRELEDDVEEVRGGGGSDGGSGSSKVRLSVQQYTTYVHGWIYYPLPSIPPLSSINPPSSTTATTSITSTTATATSSTPPDVQPPLSSPAPLAVVNNHLTGP